MRFNTGCTLVYLVSSSIALVASAMAYPYRSNLMLAYSSTGVSIGSITLARLNDLGSIGIV